MTFPLTVPGSTSHVNGHWRVMCDLGNSSLVIPGLSPGTPVCALLSQRSLGRSGSNERGARSPSSRLFLTLLGFESRRFTLKRIYFSSLRFFTDTIVWGATWRCWWLCVTCLKTHSLQILKCCETEKPLEEEKHLSTHCCMNLTEIHTRTTLYCRIEEKQLWKPSWLHDKERADMDFHPIVARSPKAPHENRYVPASCKPSMF